MFLGGLITASLVMAACGSSSEPSPTPIPTPSPMPTATPVPTPTEVPSTPENAELTQTQVFEGFGFSIDFPTDWIAETQDEVTWINEHQEDHDRSLGSGAQVGGPPDIPERKGYGVSFARAPLAVLRNAGLTDQASLEDLLNLNTRTLRWAVLDQSETSVFGVPALRATIRTQFGSGEALVGFTDDEAFLLRFRAPTEEALDEFIPTWTHMLDSIRPVTVAPRSTEELYFDEARDAISLASAKFMRFGTIFSQAYATRQRLILALLTAGVGTAFSETAAALQDIDPPDQFAAEHQALLEGYLELLRLDGEARLAVEDGDLAGFVLINGRLGEVFGTFVASMPAAFEVSSKSV